MPRNVTFFYLFIYFQCWKQREGQAVSSGSGLGGNLGGCEGHKCLYSHGTAQCAVWSHVGSSEHLWAGWALLPLSQSLSWLLPAHPPRRAGEDPGSSRLPISSAAHLSLFAAASLGHPEPQQGSCSITELPSATAGGLSSSSWHIPAGIRSSLCTLGGGDVPHLGDKGLCWGGLTPGHLPVFPAQVCVWSWDPPRCLSLCLPTSSVGFPRQEPRCSPMGGQVGRVPEPTAPLTGKLPGAECGRASRVSVTPGLGQNPSTPPSPGGSWCCAHRGSREASIQPVLVRDGGICVKFFVFPAQSHFLPAARGPGRCCRQRVGEAALLLCAEKKLHKAKPSCLPQHSQAGLGGRERGTSSCKRAWAGGSCPILTEAALCPGNSLRASALDKHLTCSRALSSAWSSGMNSVRAALPRLGGTCGALGRAQPALQHPQSAAKVLGEWCKGRSGISQHLPLVVIAWEITMKTHLLRFSPLGWSNPASSKGRFRLQPHCARPARKDLSCDMGF